jgi:polyhydroxyalkanoate synthesis regulator phasin
MITSVDDVKTPVTQAKPLCICSTSEEPAFQEYNLKTVLQENILLRQHNAQLERQVAYFAEEFVKEKEIHAKLRDAREYAHRDVLNQYRKTNAEILDQEKRKLKEIEAKYDDLVASLKRHVL